MKNRYRMFIRDKNAGGKIYWIQDNVTGKRESLQTTDKAEARQLLDLKNQPQRFAGFHFQMARTHLMFSDARHSTRTWQTVMDFIVKQKTGSTKARWERAIKSKSFDPIRNVVIANTIAEDFHAVLNTDKVSANTYLRRLHNFALGNKWLLAAVIEKYCWPKIKHGEKRAITHEEHQKIIEREKNPERKAYYKLCWHSHSILV